MNTWTVLYVSKGGDPHKQLRALEVEASTQAEAVVRFFDQANDKNRRENEGDFRVVAALPPLG